MHESMQYYLDYAYDKSFAAADRDIDLKEDFQEKYINEYQAQYKKNKESIAQKSKVYYIENKIEFLEYNKKYVKSNPDKIRVYKKRYKKKKLKSDIQFKIKKTCKSKSLEKNY